VIALGNEGIDAATVFGGSAPTLPMGPPPGIVDAASAFA
jgi:hypothetical protein